MSNFWQIVTALGAGSASVGAGEAADEAKKLNKLKEQEIEENRRHNQEILELQKEQTRFSAMTDKQKLAYQKEKEKERALERRREELFGGFNPFDPLVLKAVEISINNKIFSVGMLQTRLGQNRDIMEAIGIWLEEFGVASPKEGTKPREMIINTMSEYKTAVEKYIEDNL